MSEWNGISCLGISAWNSRYPIKFDIRYSVFVKRFHCFSDNFREEMYIVFIPFAALCCLTIKLNHPNMVGNILIKQAFLKRWLVQSCVLRNSPPIGSQRIWRQGIYIDIEPSWGRGELLGLLFHCEDVIERKSGGAVARLWWGYH